MASSRTVTVGARYLHYKGGEYLVWGIAHDSNDPTKRVVVYQSLKDSKWWIREIRDFLAILPDGRPRFEEKKHG